MDTPSGIGASGRIPQRRPAEENNSATTTNAQQTVVNTEPHERGSHNSQAIFQGLSDLPAGAHSMFEAIGNPSTPLSIPVNQPDELTTYNQRVRIGSNVQGQPIFKNFKITTTGNATADAGLFPDAEHPPELGHEEIDLTQQLREFDRLTNANKTAIREWTSVDADHDPNRKRYHDGKWMLSEGFNYELNRGLSQQTTLSASELQAIKNLDEALSRLSPYAATLTRMVEHSPQQPSPFGSLIQVGDMVTNSQRFMSASDSYTYSTQTLYEGGMSGSVNHEETNMLGFYTIEAQTAIPLTDGALSLASEDAWLFRPQSVFKVVGYAYAEPLDPLLNPCSRVSVYLQEQPNYQGEAKEIYTGATTLVRRVLPTATASSQTNTDSATRKRDAPPSSPDSSFSGKTPKIDDA